MGHIGEWEGMSVTSGVSLWALRRCLLLEESVFCGLCLWAPRVPGKGSV